jgi:polyisoprenoid-binding protein YceI
MKKLLAALAALPLLASAAPSPAAAPTKWSIDPGHSTTGFAVKHLVVSTVRGQFGKTSGTLLLDEADPTKSTVEAVIDATTINTGVADRDAHLKAADFLDAAKYPTITFKSTKVKKAGQDQLEVAGDLTLHGVTKPVVLAVSTSSEVKGMYGETRRAFNATTKIARKDFGLTWNKAVEAGPVVGDEIQVQLDLEVTKDQPKSAAAQ